MMTSEGDGASSVPEPDADTGPTTLRSERSVLAQERSAAAAHTAAQEQKQANANARRGVGLQFAAVMVAVLASVATVVVAVTAIQESRHAIDVQSAASQRSDREMRLTRALEAVGAADVPSQIGGLALLERNVGERLDLAERPGADIVEGAGADDRERIDVVNLYSDALEVVENYLKRPNVTGGPSPGQERLAVPAVPPTAQYALTRLGRLVALAERVSGVRRAVDPMERERLGKANIDLSNATLYKSYWGSFRASSLGGAVNLTRADLRGADLTKADFAGTTLMAAQLQCARIGEPGIKHSMQRVNLTRADLRGAELTSVDFTDATLDGADLRGANLAGTQFAHASIEGTKFDDSYGAPTGIDLGPDAGARKNDVYRSDGCLGRQFPQDNSPPPPAPAVSEPPPAQPRVPLPAP